eukprot:12459905-Alexandrium_andersonii.AAC.1
MFHLCPAHSQLSTAPSLLLGFNDDAGPFHTGNARRLPATTCKGPLSLSSSLSLSLLAGSGPH